MRALLAILGLVSLVYAADKTIPENSAPAALTVETAVSATLDRPPCVSISLRTPVPSAGTLLQAVHVDDDEAALDSDSDDPSFVLEVYPPWSIARVPHRRPIAALPSRGRAHGVRLGIDTPRAPPSSRPVV